MRSSKNTNFFSLLYKFFWEITILNNYVFQMSSALVHRSPLPPHQSPLILPLFFPSPPLDFDYVLAGSCMYHFSLSFRVLFSRYWYWFSARELHRIVYELA